MVVIIYPCPNSDAGLVNLLVKEVAVEAKVVPNIQAVYYPSTLHW